MLFLVEYALKTSQRKIRQQKSRLGRKIFLTFQITAKPSWSSWKLNSVFASELATVQYLEMQFVDYITENKPLKLMTRVELTTSIRICNDVVTWDGNITTDRERASVVEFE